MTEFVHELNLLEHIVAVRPILVQFKDHHLITCLVCDLKNKNNNSFRQQFLIKKKDGIFRED